MDSISQWLGCLTGWADGCQTRGQRRPKYPSKAVASLVQSSWFLLLTITLLCSRPDILVFTQVHGRSGAWLWSAALSPLIMSGQLFGHRLFSGCQFFPLAWTLTDREVISHFVSPSVSVILALLYLDKVSYYHIWTPAFSDHLKPPRQMLRRQSHVRQKGPMFL